MITSTEVKDTDGRAVTVDGVVLSGEVRVAAGSTELFFTAEGWAALDAAARKVLAG